MSYDNQTPINTPVVIVEWLDITSGSELTRRWSIGWLLSRAHNSEGRCCVLLAGTWDEDGGWADFETFKLSDVDYIEYVGKE